MADVTYNPRRTAWDPKWNGNSLGLNMQVEPALDIRLAPIKRAQTGNHILGHWIDFIDGTIKADCADVALLLMSDLCPWLNSTIVALTPPDPNTNLYTLAQPLVLHPHDKAGTDQTEDITFVKACPIASLKIKRDGKTDDLYQVEFIVYPDLVKLQGATPRLVYGYVGAVAPT